MTDMIPADSIDLQSWMTSLPPAITMLPLCQLKIPGSHDSGADICLNTKLPVANDESGFVAIAGKIRGIRKGIRRWAITQRLSISEQLLCGVRYFDFRVSHPPDNIRPKAGDFVLVHALYGPNFICVLEELRNFLDCHPGEVVIIDINHTFGLDTESSRKLKEMICNVLDFKRMCPELPSAICTLNYLRQNRYQIIVLMRHYHHDSFGCVFWSQQKIRSPWPNTNQKSILFPKLEDDLLRVRPDQMDLFFVTQCVLTATMKDVIFHWWSTLAKQLSEKTKKAAKEWLEQLPQLLTARLNIVLSDCVDIEFCSLVISLNYNDSISRL